MINRNKFDNAKLLQDRTRQMRAENSTASMVGSAAYLSQ